MREAEDQLFNRECLAMFKNICFVEANLIMYRLQLSSREEVSAIMNPKSSNRCQYP